MTTPLQAYQSLYSLTSRLVNLYPPNNVLHRLYFGILCQNFVTLTLPSGSASLGDADGYNNSGQRNSTFYISEFAKLTTLSQSIFLNEVVVNPAECGFFSNSDGFIDLQSALNISWFPNPLYQSYKLCIVINPFGVNHNGIKVDPGQSTDILFSNNKTFDLQIGLGNVSRIDLASSGYLSYFSNITNMIIYIFGYSGAGQTGTRSNIPSIRVSIFPGDDTMYFDKTSRNYTSTVYLYNISDQLEEDDYLGFIGGS